MVSHSFKALSVSLSDGLQKYKLRHGKEPNHWHEWRSVSLMWRGGGVCLGGIRGEVLTHIHTKLLWTNKYYRTYINKTLSTSSWNRHWEIKSTHWQLVRKESRVIQCWWSSGLLSCVAWRFKEKFQCISTLRHDDIHITVKYLLLGKI